MFQTYTEFFSDNKVHLSFNDYTDYFEIIGMCQELNNNNFL